MAEKYFLFFTKKLVDNKIEELKKDVEKMEHELNAREKILESIERERQELENILEYARIN